MEIVETGKMEELKQIEFARRDQIFKDYINTDDYKQALDTRARLYDACLDQRKDSHLSRARVYQLCRRDDSPVDGIIFFINNFGWTYSPKTTPKHLPFILFDFQKDAIRWIVDKIENGEDGLLEKSREMGASWLVFVYVSLWYWLFRDGTNILLGSYKEMLVDDGTIDSLFGKLDYAFDSLPKWLRPKRFSKKAHRTKLKLKNPENGNLISGDTMNSNFGRGSRKTAIMFDELGFWDYAKDAWEGTADSTNCRIANSTPNGYNYYAMLRNSGIDVLTLHWQLHPLKDEKWYEFEKLRRTPESLAQEVDISYSQSLEGRVYPDWTIDVEKGFFPYDENLPVFVAWDFGLTDDTAIIWAQPYRGKLRIIDTFSKTGKLIDFFIPFVTGIVSSEFQYTPRELDKIKLHQSWRRGTHFGDPAGRFQNQVTNDTVLTKLKQAGITINFNDNWKEFQTRKTAARLLIKDGIELNFNEDTKYFDICMTNAAYPKVKYQGVDEVRSQKPMHNYTSHYRSAFEYLALGLAHHKLTGRKPVDKFKKGSFDNKKIIGY